jgi:prolyl-tRNA editing enzyme YbaK/EbsC (Cys-tRNA(Pro) deacylase)
MQFGNLTFEPVMNRLDLVAEPTATYITEHELRDIFVSEIDPELADTAAFCERYGVGLDVSANCVIVEAKRADRVWYAACMILATDKADVNNAVRRQLDARKISFAPMDTAVGLTGMEYGGINPIGLPSDWPILVDEHVAAQEYVIIGSGLRKSKLLIPGKLLAGLPRAEVLNISK